MLPLNTYVLPFCVLVTVSNVASWQRSGASLVSGGGPKSSTSSSAGGAGWSPEPVQKQIF